MHLQSAALVHLSDPQLSQLACPWNTPKKHKSQNKSGLTSMDKELKIGQYCVIESKMSVKCLVTF